MTRGCAHSIYAVVVERDYKILIKTPKQNNAKDNPQKKARQQMKRF